MIASWPLIDPMIDPNFRSAMPAQDSAFVISDLAPGDYRAASVTAEQWARRNEPGAMAEWLAKADTFTLAPKEIRALTLNGSN